MVEESLKEAKGKPQVVDALTTKKKVKRGLLYLMVPKVSIIFNNLEFTGAPDKNNLDEAVGPETAVQQIEKWPL